MATVGTLESIPILKPGVILEHMHETLHEDELKLLNHLDEKSSLQEIAERVGFPRELAREVALRLVERQILLLATPESAEDVEEAERRQIVPGMRYLEDLDRVRLKGTTDRANVPKLLLKVHRDGLTGILRIGRPKQVPGEEDYYKNIYFLKGKIIDCRTHPFQPAECLGRVLQRAGTLEDKIVIESLRRVKAQKVRQGEALVSMGAISPDFLHTALQNQISFKIGETFEWERCLHDFLPKEGFSNRIARIDCSISKLLFDTLWKRYPLKDLTARLWEYKEKFVGKVNAPPFDIIEFEFEKVLGKFWEEILNKDTPFKRLMIVGNMKEIQTRRALFALYCTGMVEFLVESREDPNVARAESLKEQLKNLEKRSHFDALTVHWSVDGGQIEAAYKRRMAKLERERKGATGIVELLYDEIVRLTKIAYEEIRTDELRKKYREAIFDPFFIEFNSDIFRQKGESYMFTKDEPNLAIAELESAIEVYDREGEYYALLGLATFLKHYPKDADKQMQARILIDKGIRMNPRSDVVYLCEGLMYKYQGQAAQAAKSLAKAVEKNPQNRFARIELHSLKSRVSEGERDAAIKEYLNRKSSSRKEGFD